MNRPRKTTRHHTQKMTIANTFVRGRAALSQEAAFRSMLLRNRTAIAMAIASVDIFSQNEIARSWRGGSVTMRIMPVIARITSEPQNHGQNRSTVALSV